MSEPTPTKLPQQVPAKEQLTEYVVLELIVGASEGWSGFARESARDGNAAIKAALEGNTDGGTFVAIPARSWKPVKVTPKVETTLVLEDVKA
jgi:hypothetical protein